MINSMTCNKIYLESLGVTAEVSAFCPEGGVAEWQALLHVEPRGEGFAGQWSRILQAEAALLARRELDGARCVAKRYFLSDSTNQQPLMQEACQCETASVSLIQQQPLDGSKIAAGLYLQRGIDITKEDGMTVGRHNGYTHLWQMGLTETASDSAMQTEAILRRYETELAERGATLADNCIRTWFFVRDVDTQYAGMVRARRENFIQQGLTEHTHYIASTGIGGLPARTEALVQMGAYALMGFEPSQLRYLYARTHLNPTYEYGVTFERGSVVQYGDRDHIFISGTASIDNRGRVVHVGDIVGQTQRMWENVEALLAEAGATYDDVTHLIVYLRDTADYETVRQMFAQRFPDIPVVITLAPVCRPTWLIEMECMAIRGTRHKEYREL